MKRFAMLIVCMLVLPGLSLAADQASFENGQEEVIAVLAAPGYEATVNLEVPAGYYVTNATMNVTGLASENNSSAYPEGVSIRLNDSALWAFQNMGFGALGMQDRFSANQKLAKSSFASTGGVKTHYIRLPKEAVVESAIMEVRGSQPSTGNVLWNDTGAVDKERLGLAVSNAGDINGDGYDDVIVGTDNEKAYLYYGGSPTDDVADLAFSAVETGEWFGRYVSGAGDVNSDGYDDLIIGAFWNSAGGSQAGRAYIYFGGAGMDNTTDVVITGKSADVRLGSSVSNAGDVNGDGYDDVLVGAPGYNGAPGNAYVFFGGQNMDNTPDVTLDENITGWSFGWKLSDAGDVNGDGYDDVIVGGWNGGSDVWGYIFFGGQNMDNRTDVILKFPLAWGDHNYCLSGAGDVNNDGYADVMVGNECDCNEGEHAGRTYIFYGNSMMDATADVIISGEEPGDLLGASVSGAGDTNNDGYDDVIIGALRAGNLGGMVYVFFGGNPMDNVSDYNISEPADGDFGQSVSNAGDVNSDGYDDLIASAPYNDSGGDSKGIIYVFSLYTSNLTGVLNPGVAIGSKNIWKGTGYFNSSAELDDFAGELNAYLKTSSISGKDSYGNAFVDVPVNTNASGVGVLALFNLNIVYRYTASMLDFAPTLGDFLTNHQDKKDANGIINVPINIHAQTAGRIKLSGLDLDISPDLPPAQVKEIMNVELLEDGWNSSLIDLYQYFQDDLDPDTFLDLSIASSTNSSYVTVGIRNKRYLAGDAFTGDVNDNWTGTVEVVVSCSDHWGHRTESNLFTIFVKNVNDEPIITSTPSSKAEAGNPYSYNVTAVDGDNDTLKFNLPKAPAGMTIDAVTGMIQWLPRASGNHNVTVNVTDGTASAEQRFSIYVPNKGPRITSQPVLNGTTGVEYKYNVTAEDDNLDALKYSLTSSIIGMAIDAANGTISWTPAYANNYDVVVVVSDGKASAAQNYTVKVVQGNRAPKFVSIPIKTATAGVPYTYQARAMDEDNDVLSVSLVVCPSGMAIDSVSGEVRWTPAAAGNFSVILKVADGKGGDALQEFVINVVDRVKAKVAIDRPSENGRVRGKVTVSGTATKGTLEVLSAQVRIDGGDWADAAGNYTWQYSLDTTKLKNGEHLLEARAFDGKDYSDLAAVNFTVDNQKAQGKGFIPGFTGMLVLFVMASVAVLRFRRKQA